GRSIGTRRVLGSGHVNVELTVPDDVLDEIARRTAEIVLAQLAADRGSARPEYLDVKAAAAYSGMTVGRLRKLIERRKVAVSQEARGCRIFVARRDLDAWMEERRG